MSDVKFVSFLNVCVSGSKVHSTYFFYNEITTSDCISHITTRKHRQIRSEM